MKNRIKECRQALGLSQNQLAFKAKMTTSAIANYESGVTNPTIQRTETLAEILGVTPGYLIGWTNRKGEYLTPRKIVVKVNALIDYFVDSFKQATNERQAQARFELAAKLMEGYARNDELIIPVKEVLIHETNS